MEKGAKQTGLEFLRDPSHTIKEIVAAVSSTCPPVELAHCDAVTCVECWSHWLLTGEAVPQPEEVAAS